MRVASQKTKVGDIVYLDEKCTRPVTVVGGIRYLVENDKLVLPQPDFVYVKPTVKDLKPGTVFTFIDTYGTKMDPYIKSSQKISKNECFVCWRSNTNNSIFVHKDWEVEIEEDD